MEISNIPHYSAETLALLSEAQLAAVKAADTVYIKRKHDLPDADRFEIPDNVHQNPTATFEFGIVLQLRLTSLNAGKKTVPESLEKEILELHKLT